MPSVEMNDSKAYSLIAKTRFAFIARGEMGYIEIVLYFLVKSTSLENGIYSSATKSDWTRVYKFPLTVRKMFQLHPTQSQLRTLAL